MSRRVSHMVPHEWQLIDTAEKLAIIPKPLPKFMTLGMCFVCAVFCLIEQILFFLKGIWGETLLLSAVFLVASAIVVIGMKAFARAYEANTKMGDYLIVNKEEQRVILPRSNHGIDFKNIKEFQIVESVYSIGKHESDGLHENKISELQIMESSAQKTTIAWPIVGSQDSKNTELIKVVRVLTSVINVPSSIVTYERKKVINKSITSL